MGRKKKNFNAKVKAFNCGDTDAWEICLKKKINLSEEITRFVRSLAYKDQTLEQARVNTLNRLHAIEIEREKEFKKLESKYETLARFEAMKLNKLDRIQTQKELELQMEANNETKR